MTESARQAEVLVIGAGIAGASVAAELAGERSVLVVEAESQPGYHSTGRSAAQFIQNYGPADVRALTAASRGFFEGPPEGFAEQSLVAPRGMLTVAAPGQEAAMAAALAAGLGLERIAAEAALAKVPALRREAVAEAAWEADSQDIDVAALHQGYLRWLRRRGGEVVTDARVEALARADGLWRAETRQGAFAAPIVVDAAGAWADEVAALAGLAPLGLVPKRRTALLVDAPADAREVERWPLVVDAEELWYFKPEPGGKLLVSPADATPVPPGDVRPDELDVAIAVDRLMRALDIQVRRIEHQWAGLRTFSADGSLVIGWEPRAEGFFWLAGQGGYGIQTAPAAARSAAALIRGAAWPADVRAAGLAPEPVSPARFR